MAVLGVFAAIAVPSAAHVGSAVSSAEGARRLALVLRAAQAEAQSRSGPVRVEVGAGGDYAVTAAGGALIMSGESRDARDEHLPGRRHRVQRSEGGPRLPGSSSPRAGHFSVDGRLRVRHGGRAALRVRAMHVMVRSTASRAHRRSSGFSLIEVVVASGLLLATVTAVTFCVTVVSASGARLRRVMDADRAVRLVADRLAALPFCAAPADDGSASGSAAEDLVDAVFPHADASRNVPDARYVTTAGGGAPAGAFATVFSEGDVEVLCVARFLAAVDGPPLEPAAVEGWAGGDGARPPGCALTVQLTAASRSAARSASFTRAALALVEVRPSSAVSP